MNLHKHKKDFKELSSIVAVKMNLSESAIIRDWFNLFNKFYQSFYSDWVLNCIHL